MIKLEGVTKIYGKEEYKVRALNNIDLSIKPGEFISIMGPSGSGKSTLLNIIGCMDSISKGKYILNDEDITHTNNKKASIIRRDKISFVFQDFALIKDYTVYENIEVPILYKKYKESKKSLIYKYIKKLGLEGMEKKKVQYLSGGQQQRVAIARALVTDPDIILADEPTGSLDQKTGSQILNILKSINENGKTVIIVTHDPNVSEITNRKIEIVDGRIKSDLTK